MIHVPKQTRRAGLSLLEVIVALAIFLFSLIGLGQLLTQGKEQALAVQFRTQAIQICQAKMAEVMAGAIPVSGSQSNVTLDEDPDWTWSMEANQGAVTGLWVVTVQASRKMPDGSPVEATLTQMILDPSIRGTGPTSSPMNSGGGTGGGSGGGQAGGASSGGQGTSGGAGPSGRSGSSSGNNTPGGR